MTGMTAPTATLANAQTLARPADWTLPVGIIALVGLAIGFQPMPRDPDLWFHLAGGEYMIKYGAVPDADPFSFTRSGAPWTPHSWLFDLSVWLAWNHLGPRATEALFAVVFAAAMLIAYNLIAARGVRPQVALALGCALAIAAANSRGLRPQTMSLFFFALVIALLDRNQLQPRKRILVVMPLVFLLWAQVHAACVMGLIVIAAWIAGRGLDALGNDPARPRSRELLTLLAALALSAVATLLTPHRVTHFAYVAMTANLESLQDTQEWQAPQPFSLAVPDVYAYALFLGVMVALARGQRRINWAEIGLCAAPLLLAQTAVRHIPLACVAAAPLLGSTLGRGSLPSESAPRTLRRIAPQVGVVAAILLALLWNYPQNVFARYAAVEPVAGARALARLDGTWRVFTTYNTGSYVLHAAPGRLLVFIDSRADVYGDELFADMRHVQRGRGWEDMFERWDINAAVLEREDPLVDILRRHRAWHVLAEDPGAVTFIRADVLPQMCQASKHAVSAEQFAGPRNERVERFVIPRALRADHAVTVRQT